MTEDFYQKKKHLLDKGLSSQSLLIIHAIPHPNMIYQIELLCLSKVEVNYDA